jgi:hypothetical protein
MLTCSLDSSTITRLRLGVNEETHETASAYDHGKVRFEQGYTVPMLNGASFIVEFIRPRA